MRRGKRTDRYEPVLVGVALAVLTAIVVGVFLGASAVTTVVVVAAALVALWVLTLVS